MSFFKGGREFIVDGDGFFRMLAGQFCSEAWDRISRYAYAALQGGSIMRGWTKQCGSKTQKAFCILRFSMGFKSPRKAFRSI